MKKSLLNIAGLGNISLSTASQLPRLICTRRPTLKSHFTQIFSITSNFLAFQALNGVHSIVFGGGSHHDAHAIARIHGHHLCCGRPIGLGLSA
jgi:hypothetical protein